MKKIKILDTSLRDGGRVIDCKFDDSQIHNLINHLVNSRIDIVEVGFLRGNTNYFGNSTFFSEIEQIARFIPSDRRSTQFVVFADYGQEYGMWEFERLKQYDGTSIDGIRVGYRKNNLDEAVEIFKVVINNGYKLFMQGVESLSYSDNEFLYSIGVANKIHPYSFGIVDTFGTMYKDDALRLFDLADRNLDENIAIDFHSHNNQQLSFSLAQEIIARNSKRTIVIDGTLEGMGRGVGNLNTELIAEYLNRKLFYNYNMDSIFDAIDDNIAWIKRDHVWHYQIPYYMAGLMSSHPNNISYLMDRHKLRTKDLRHILSMIEPAKRKRYDYDNIERLCIEYFGTKVDDGPARAELREKLAGKKVLVIAPGKSITERNEEITSYIESEKPIVVSINFVYPKTGRSFSFFGNERSLNKCVDVIEPATTIITSNIKFSEEIGYIINYNSLVDRSVSFFDNSVIMLFYLLRDIGVNNVAVAGLDGLSGKEFDSHFCDTYNIKVSKNNFQKLNADLHKMILGFYKTLDASSKIEFITPSIFVAHPN